MGQTATADRTTTTATPTSSGDTDTFREAPTFGGFDLEGTFPPAGSLAEEKARFDAALATWEIAHETSILDFELWTARNWSDYIVATGGRGWSPTTPSYVMDFISGVWGNFWTDAPAQFAKELGFDIVEAGAALAGGALAGPAGLLISSVLATTVEMVVTAVLGIDEKSELVTEYTKGFTDGSKMTQAIYEQAIQAAAASLGYLKNDVNLAASKAATATAPQLAAVRTRMDKAAAMLRAASAQMKVDRRLCQDQLSRWVQLHMVPAGSEPESVDPERFEAALESVGGREALDAKQPSLRTTTAPTIQEQFCHGDQVSVPAHFITMTQIFLEDAGLRPDLVVAGVARGETQFRWVTASDPGTFARFVSANWPGFSEPEICEDEAFDPMGANWANVSVEVVKDSSGDFIESITVTPTVQNVCAGPPKKFDPKTFTP